MASAISVKPSECVVTFLREQLPDGSYGTLKTKNKELILHYLIIHGQPDSSILKWIGVCNAKYQGYINQKDTAQQIHQLTTGEVQILHPTGMCPLALATLMQRVNVVAELCQSPHINPEVQDRKGWTALQHAIVVGHPGILALVEEATDRFQSGTEVKTEAKAASDKTQLVARERFPFLRSILRRPDFQDTDRAIRFQVHQGQLDWWNQADFFRETGAYFYDGLWGTKEALFENWRRPPLHDESFMIWMRERWHEYSAKKPLLLLTRFQGAGMGIISQRKLPVGCIVCTFGSEFNPPSTFESDQMSPYSNKLATGVRIRNYGSMVNDGFPTVVEIGVVIEGIEICALVAISPLNPQTQILLDSGPMNPIKWGRRCEMNLEQAYEFFPRKDSPLQIWRRVKEELGVLNEQRAEFVLDHSSRKTKLCYLFSTPPLCLSMVLESRLHARTVDTLLKDPQFLSTAGITGATGPNVIEFYMQTLALIKQFETAVPRAIKEAIRRDLAIRFLTNVRAAMIAFDLTFESYTESSTKQSLSERFVLLFTGADALFNLLEEKGDQQAASKAFGSLEREEQLAIIGRSKRTCMLIFGERDRIHKIYGELEDEPS